MLASEVQTSVAALLEVCAQQRAGDVPMYPVADETTRLSRTVQAEAAGRELLSALVRPEPWSGLTPAATIRRMIGYLQTVISASAPETVYPPLITIQAHHVELDGYMQRFLRDAALCLVLAVYDDGANSVAVRVEAMPKGARLTVERDGLASSSVHPVLHGLKTTIVANGGTWGEAHADHGQSTIVTVMLPATSQREVAQ